MTQWELEDAVFEICGGIEESLPNVLILKLRKFLMSVFAVRVQGGRFHNTPDG
jgi:hypothetical protein